MAQHDLTEKKQKPSYYENHARRLDRRDNEFSSKKFQRIRNFSTHRNLLKSLKKIGMCLNEQPTINVPSFNLDKVCFILINDYDEEENELGVGPLNDGYLVALNHFRLGFKIFYLYNSRSDEFPFFLGFFMKNTTKSLTVFFSGRNHGKKGIEFNRGNISKNFICDVITRNCNGQSRAIFITDTISGGSAFDIDKCSNVISLSVRKNGPRNLKEFKKSHGILTYYLCKYINECPNITPNDLVSKMNTSLQRFNEILKCEFSNEGLDKSPIFE